LKERTTVFGLDWTFLVYWMMATTIGWIMGGFFAAGISLIVTGLAIGVLQWIPLEKRLAGAGRWIPATWAGWGLAQFELVLVNPSQNTFVTGLLVGLLVGIAQWLLLRNHLPLAAWWVAINVVAWTTGFWLMPGIFTSGMIPGLVTGLALDVLLRNAGI